MSTRRSQDDAPTIRIASGERPIRVETSSGHTAEVTTVRAPARIAIAAAATEDPDDAPPPSMVAEALRNSLASVPAVTDRYHVVELLGRGGMGEVSRAMDNKIGREVATKRLRSDIGLDVAQAAPRFMREARVQALLDHPAIVPVYDLGYEASGAPFFTMKRVRGETLFDILEDIRRLRTSKAGIRSKHRLLSSFVTVCFAMHYAHQRGVVHRDLKPENIMLGAHGEVYVLDWGVARILEARPSFDEVTEDDPDATRPGDMVGTPGYMAPEQVLGALDEVDAKSDIFALGAILFEILTMRPLIPGNTSSAILQATLDINRSPPPLPFEAPPELYQLALDATRYDKNERPRSARVLAETIERYLDGDRDEELRKKLSDVHAGEAKLQLSRALGDGKAEEQELARKHAMREAGRALAMRPDHAGARGVMLRLFAKPPKSLPAEVERDLERVEARQLDATSRDNVLRQLVWVLLTPLIAAMGVRVAWLVGIINASVVLSMVLAVLLWRGVLPRDTGRIALFASSIVMGTAMSAIFGPLVLVPGFVAVNTMLFATYAPPRARPWMIGFGCAAIGVPLVLEVLGVVPPSMHFTDAGLLLLPRAAFFREAVALPALFAVSALGVTLPTLLASRLRAALRRAEEQLALQNWHLSQLAPGALDDADEEPTM
ncbi:MAG: serine/threonine-protein kinase [Polyangiaceae bacterium]